MSPCVGSKMILTLISQQISTLNLFTATSYTEKEKEEQNE